MATEREQRPAMRRLLLLAALAAPIVVLILFQTVAGDGLGGSRPADGPIPLGTEAVTRAADPRHEAATSGGPQEPAGKDSTGTASPVASPPPAAPAEPERFGVITPGSNQAVVQHQLQQLGMRWWYTWDNTATAPAGTQRVLLLRLSPTAAPKSSDELQAWADQQPGAYWLVGNEPNVPGQDNVTPARYAELLHYYATTIKAIDPAAKLIGPNILNWSFTCSGCAGFVSGQEWTAQLLAAYQKQYGSSPPLDVWGIHTYSITWDQLPMVNAARDIQQLQELRRYLSSQTAERQKPIWLTEFGVIWGFEGYQFVGDGECANRSHCLGPEGRFRDDLIAAYLNTLLDWLTANADGHNIERWFLYTSYGGREPYASTYAGISLLTAGGTDAVLSAFGEQYRHAVGQP